MKSRQIMRGATAGVLALGVLTGGGQAIAAMDDSMAQGRYGMQTTGRPTRTIVIDETTRHINVTRQETVSLHDAASGQTVTWTFDTLGTRPFPLSRIVPGAGGAVVYVQENPLYIGN